MPVKLGSIIVPWAGEWMPSGHYQLTGIWNPNFRSDHKGRGLPECPVQTLQWAPTHSDASSWYNHRVWVLSVKGIYLGLSLRPYVDFVFSLPAILLHFLCQCPVEATTSIHKHFHPKFLSHLTLGKSWVHDLCRPTFYSRSAPPWRIHSSTLLGMTFNKTLSALSLHCSKYV